MKALFVLCLVALGLAAQTSSLKIDVAPKTPVVKADADVPFEVTVKDAKGAPVSGAEVVVIATMVDMDHGEFKYDAKASKAGSYAFSPRFVMGGMWNLVVKVKKGSDTASISKKIDVKD